MTRPPPSAREICPTAFDAARHLVFEVTAALSAESLPWVARDGAIDVTVDGHELRITIGLKP